MLTASRQYCQQEREKNVGLLLEARRKEARGPSGGVHSSGFWKMENKLICAKSSGKVRKKGKGDESLKRPNGSLLLSIIVAGFAPPDWNPSMVTFPSILADLDASLHVILPDKNADKSSKIRNDKNVQPRKQET
ncbi:hypothetical protein V8G54_037079 [Vigna mungo]|uniref:Uncharacterized protein n=1 Tax=Vigna mungo TaxID=3915 RepID=A0AAQ3MIL6_VIGMU